MSEFSLDRRTLLFGLVVGGSVSAASSPVGVSEAWMRPAMAGMTSAGYMRIVNHSSVPDRLLGALSPVAASLGLHETRMFGVVSTMRVVRSVLIPARGQANLTPGGFHLMLVGLKRSMKPGERMPVTLIFQHAGRLRVWLTVRASAPSSTSMPTMPGMTM